MERKHSFSLQCMIRRGRKNRKEQYPIYLRITVDGIRAEIATKVMASVEKWNATKGRLTGTLEDTRLSNRLLDNFEHKAREIYNRFLLEGKNFTAEDIKNEITGLEQSKRMLIATFEEEVAKMELREGNGYAKGTLKTWNVTLRHLKQFLKEHYDCEDVSFKQLDYQFISDLDWFARTKWKCQTNVVLKHMQRLQRIIKMAINRGWLQKNPFENFHCKPEKSHRTFLSKDELKRIESKIFSVQRLENVKDIFIFSCYTGLAYVDIAQLTVDNLHTGVDGKEWIYTFRQKTSNKSNIPLLPQALKIIEKYRNFKEPFAMGSLLPIISNVKMNVYLKRSLICVVYKKPNLSYGPSYLRDYGNIKQRVPMETVSNMLRHTKISTTQIYAKVLENKVSEDMMALESKLLKTFRATASNPAGYFRQARIQMQ